MDLSVIPNSDQVRDEVRKYFVHLQENHNKHDEELRIKAKYKFTEIYLVTNNTKMTQMIMEPTLYWIFTFLGLSLPFRWFRSIFFPDCELQNTKICEQHKHNTCEAQNNHSGI